MRHAVASVIQTLTPPASPAYRRPETDNHADKLRTASSVIPDNRIVVHELLINREYRIEMEDCLEQRGVLNSAILAAMRHDIQSGRNSDPWVLAMAENIKGKLQHLLTPGNSMHKLIGDALDLEIIAQELRTGGFSYEKFFSFMASILPRLCAPVRDDEVKVLAENTLQNGDVVDRLEALMRFIDLLQLDYANFMLQQTAPELVKHAIPYEQKCFAEDLDRGVYSLAATEHWWRESRAKVIAEAARRDPENLNMSHIRPAPDRFYAQMLLDVFTDINSNVEIPETLRLDRKRVDGIRSRIRYIVTTGAILLQSKNHLKRDSRSQWRGEASRILSVLENATSPTDAREGIQVALESSRSMPSATKVHIRSMIKRIVENSYENAAAAVKGTEESAQMVTITEPVMRLLLVRLRGHILSRLSAITASEKVRATSTASERLATLGLPEFVSSVGALVEELGRVGVVDRESHALWYEVVAKNVEAQETGSVV